MSFLPFLRGSCLGLSLCFVAATAYAGQVKTNAFPNQGIFAIQVAGTDQEFYGRADRVVSVAFQEYTTGAFIVSEVTIDMEGGNQLLRIYATRAPSTDDVNARMDALSQAAEALGGSTGVIAPTAPTTPTGGVFGDAEQRAQTAAGKVSAGIVVKAWPATTHAKTVEFSVGTKEELQTFYRNFRDLLASKPIQVKQGGRTLSRTEAANNSTSATNLVSINRIGGSLFVIE